MFKYKEYLRNKQLTTNKDKTQEFVTVIIGANKCDLHGKRIWYKKDIRQYIQNKIDSLIIQQ